MTSVAKTNWTLVLLLWVAGLGAAAQYGKVAVVYDRLALVYPEAGETLGFAVSLVGLLGMFLGVIAGLLVARIRYRRALLGGLWLGAALSLYQATLPAMPLLLASRALEGLSHLALVVAAPTLIAEVTAPKDTGKTLTLWGTFFGVAFSILTFAGLPLVDRFGVPALFLCHAALMASMALILTPRLPSVTRTEAFPPLSLGRLLARHVAIYRSPFIAAPGIGWLFYTFCFVSILTLLPLFLAPALRAPIIGAMPLISIVSSLTLGVWSLRYLSAVTVIVIGFLAAALCAFGLVWSAGEPVLCLMLAAALGLVQGASFAAVADLNPRTEDRAAAYGSMAQTGNIGNTLGTPVMASIIAAGGNAAFMSAAAITLVLGAASHLWLSLRRGGPVRRDATR